MILSEADAELGSLTDVTLIRREIMSNYRPNNNGNPPTYETFTSQANYVAGELRDYIRSNHNWTIDRVRELRDQEIRQITEQQPVTLTPSRVAARAVPQNVGGSWRSSGPVQGDRIEMNDQVVQNWVDDTYLPSPNSAVRAALPSRYGGGSQGRPVASGYSHGGSTSGTGHLTVPSRFGSHSPAHSDQTVRPANLSVPAAPQSRQRTHSPAASEATIRPNTVPGPRAPGNQVKKK